MRGTKTSASGCPTSGLLCERVPQRLTAVVKSPSIRLRSEECKRPIEARNSENAFALHEAAIAFRNRPQLFVRNET
jgi:hypothetical protein